MSKIEKVIEAIKTSSATQLHKLLDENPELANENSAQAISLLQLSIYYGFQDGISLFRKYKSTLDIFEAASLGEVDLVKKHIENGAVLDQFAADGFTTLGLACFFGREAVVDLLLASGADPQLSANNDFKVAPIHSATAISNIAIVQKLITAGADINQKQQGGVTPLHSAAHNGSAEIFNLLLDNGADHLAKLENGSSILKMAEENGHSDIIKILEDLKH